MILYPAVDIRGGQAVRLTQGDYDREQVYASDPVDAALSWVREGAQRLHVVDLDGARDGKPANLAHVRRMVGEVDVPVQLGGGLRDPEMVKAVLDAGVSRVVLGTAAQSNPGMIAELVADYGPERVVVAVDSRGGRVSVAGWREATATTPAQLVESLAGHGARVFLYTPVEVDGTMQGPDLGQLDAVERATEQTGGEVIYSGGVGSLADLERLRERSGVVSGVIVGRALYEHRFTLAEANAVLAA